MAVVGRASTLIITVSVEAAQVPFTIAHTKIFAPTLNPVTADVGEIGLVGVPVPENNVHIPVPIVGAFPTKAEEELQIV